MIVVFERISMCVVFLCYKRYCSVYDGQLVAVVACSLFRSLTTNYSDFSPALPKSQLQDKGISFTHCFYPQLQSKGNSFTHCFYPQLQAKGYSFTHCFYPQLQDKGYSFTNCFYPQLQDKEYSFTHCFCTDEIFISDVNRHKTSLAITYISVKNVLL